VALSHSSNQILIGQPLASGAVNEASDALRRVPLDVAFVKTESELIDITVHMLRANMMECAVDSTLKNSEEAFNAVRCDTVANKLASAVIDGLMYKPRETAIGGELVGMDCRAGFDMLFDFIMDHVAIRRLYGHGARAPVSLAHPENRCLANCAAPGVQFLVGVFVGFLTANISLINLDNAAQLFELVAASLAEPPKNEPCGFLCDTDLLCKLHGRDALARRDDEVHRVNLLMQRDMRTLEDCAGADSEVDLTLVAAIEATLAGGDALA
jgi:hypothetical protein